MKHGGRELSSLVGHLEPLISDYLLKRDRDLVITILCGSVAEPDARLQDADMVTMVEL